MKRIAIFLLLLIPSLAYATNEVEITVSGSGVDKETAIKTALRSALEQTYGAFVSTNTKIQNDKLMSDEIVSLSRGNIQKYKILSESQMQNGHWYVLLQATVNINQLAKYVKGNSASVKVDMEAFHAKVLLEEMNAEAERQIIDHLITELESIEDMWSYRLSDVEPGVYGDDYTFRGTVRVYMNDNTWAAMKLLKDVLSTLNVTSENKIYGWSYYTYAGPPEEILSVTFRGLSNDYIHFFHVTLRNKYKNKLLNAYNNRNYYIDYDYYDGGVLYDIITNKIKFTIQPLSLVFQYRDYIEAKNYSDDVKHIMANYFNNGRVKSNVKVYDYDFYAAIPKEEAIKIKKLSIQPLEKAGQMEKAEYGQRSGIEQSIEISAIWGSGNEEEEGEEEENQPIYSVVEKDPEFPGGQDALKKYLRENLKYPQSARDNNIYGQVYVTFVVERDGTITNPRIMKDIGGGCGAEAVRLVKSMPKWIPGKKRGEAVRVQYNLPILFGGIM